MMAAERQRRYRRRLAQGDQHFRDDLPLRTLTRMIDDGLIAPNGATDPTYREIIAARERIPSRRSPGSTAASGTAQTNLAATESSAVGGKAGKKSNHFR